MFRVPAAAALSLMRFGQHDLAVRFLRSGRKEIRPYSKRAAKAMAASYHAAAEALLDSGRVGAMLQVLDEANAILETTTAHNIIALWKAESGEPATAIIHWQQSLRIDSTQAEAHRHLAALYRQQSDLANAEFHERRAARASASR